MGKSWENHLWMGYFSGMWWHNLRFGLKMCVWKWHPKKSHGFIMILAINMPPFGGMPAYPISRFLMNSCLPPILMFTRCGGFWPTNLVGLCYSVPIGDVPRFLTKQLHLIFGLAWKRRVYTPQFLALQFTVLSVFKWGLILVVSCFQTNIYLAVWTWKSMCKLPT